MRKIVIKTRKIKRPRGKNRLVSVLFVFAILIPVVVSAELPNNSHPYPPDLYSQCFDGIDNDGDGKIDLKDSDCPKCFDSVDNDGDKDIDLADSDCPKPKKGFFSAAAAAFLSVNNGPLGGGNIPIGENIGGGVIASGGNIATSGTTCSGRISVFPRRIKTESGFFYVVQHTACINLIPVGEASDLDEMFLNTRRRIRTGGNIASGGNIQVGEAIPVGNTIPTSEDINAGGVILSGGLIPIGDAFTFTNIPIGSPVPIGTNIPIGGSIGSGSIPIGGTIPGGGII